VVVLVLLVAAGVVWQVTRGGGGGSPNGSPTPTGGSSTPVVQPNGCNVVNPKPKCRILAGTNPIKHIVFLVKENRTFDTFFGKYPGAEGATSGKGLSATH